jgi:hypothetical protein
MMKPSQVRNCHHLVPCMLRGTRWFTRLRNLLANTLMWSCPVEVCHIRDFARVEAASREGSRDGRGMLAAHSCAKRSQIALGRFACTGVLRISMVLVAAKRVKHGPNLLSLSQIRYFGVCPYGVASRSCCVIAHKGCPLLASWMVSANSSHVPLNGSLAGTNAEFQ